MGIEYQIKFAVPAGYDPSALIKKLPDAIERPSMADIYSYAVEPAGFYFVDHLVIPAIASLALRRLIDEALRHGERVEIIEP
ncbi:hypothetical protein [Achromobacter deleyi]|uniref:hypothetical protein n=1 Tax=Achromobacter deleyi TaxID=1353891 RepID=UPI001468677A|nr:hypothetical protein [Achromobacter deleyi]CAB3890589.1 hypothetical protein LMG3412_03732 [Achromobacter deleyi]